MAHLHFGGGRELTLNFEQPNAIHKGAGLHRLTVPVTLDARNSIDGGVAVTLTGFASISQSSIDWLGPWTTDRPIVTQAGMQFDGMIVLPLSDEQLAVIEQRRAGGDINLMLNVNIVLGYDPNGTTGKQDDRWPAREYQETIQILREAWVRLLSQTAIATSLAVVVPVPLDSTTEGRVGAHLRDAIRKVNNGEFADAVIAARKAIDDFDSTLPKRQSENVIARTKREARTLDQRLAMLRHALHTLASPGAHGDPVADSIKWDRESALAVIAGVSALVACKRQETSIVDASTSSNGELTAELASGSPKP